MSEIEPYALLGNDPVEGQDKNIVELRLDDHVGSVDPKRYFITSGEAIAKCEKLESDCKKLLSDVRKLLKALKVQKSDASYLETSWNDGRLLLKRKNKRVRKPK